MNCPRLLNDHGGAPGNRVEIHAPSPGGVRFDRARYSHKSEGQLVVAILEVDAPAVHFNPAELKRRKRERGPNHHLCREAAGRLRKPLGKIPITAGVAHKIQTWPVERERPETDVAAKQAGPAQTHR